MKTPLTYFLLSIFFGLPLFGKTQMVTISGIISSDKTGNIIENVNVFDSQSNIGTISDKFGFYQLMLHPGKIDLSVTCDGFDDFRQKLELKTDTTLTITLKPVHHIKGKKKNHKDLQASAENNLTGVERSCEK